MLRLLQLMRSNEMSPRCMLHNNALTLYCLTEKRTLCVNCTYGDTKHRMHRVLPLKDSFAYLKKDNNDFLAILPDKMGKLDDTIKISQKNVTMLNQGLLLELRRMEEVHLR